MSGDSFTEVTHRSWVSRIGSAIIGILIGLVLFIISFILLFWNEGRSVKQYNTLKEAGGAVVSVTSDRVDTVNEGKLIHTTGKANTDVTLRDPFFRVSANVLMLKRTVEMYQWHEDSQTRTEKTSGGGERTVRTYSYNKRWVDRPISSSRFKKPQGHQNPGAIPYSSTHQVANKVTLGAFTLSPSLLSKINNFRLLPIQDDHPVLENIKGKARVYSGGFYIGADPSSPQVGDVRVTFSAVTPTRVSVIAKQVGNSFKPYQTSRGGAIELLQLGAYSPDAMISEAQESNRIFTWILRIVGFVLMLLGLTMVFKPCSVVADVVPILGTIVGVGVFFVSFLLAAVLSLITIAIAWIVYRPLLAVVMMSVAGVLIVAIAIKGKLRSKKAMS